MSQNTNALHGLKLISDWAKWLITIEAAAVALIGTVAEKGSTPYLTKVFITASIICFLISIAAAALLLLSLPEIVQTLPHNTNIWMTRDSIIGRVFHLNIQGFAVLESLFFGIGFVCFAAAIVVTVWRPVVHQ